MKRKRFQHLSLLHLCKYILTFDIIEKESKIYSAKLCLIVFFFLCYRKEDVKKIIAEDVKSHFPKDSVDINEKEALQAFARFILFHFGLLGNR